MAKKFDAIYARQSVDKKDSVSIETQIEACRTKCDKNPVIYDADKGFSGKNTDRPDLQRLINDIEHNTIKKVVVYKLDRISRNITDFYKLYEIMQLGILLLYITYINNNTRFSNNNQLFCISRLYKLNQSNNTRFSNINWRLCIL